MKFYLPLLALCVIQLSYGQLHDLPETVAAKAAHFEAVRRAEQIIANAPPQHRGSTKKPKVEETSQHQLGVNVQDTPEVAAAKAAHYNAYKKAEHAAAAANVTTHTRASVSSTHHTRPHSSSGGKHSVVHIEIPLSNGKQKPTSEYYPTHHEYPDYYPGHPHYPHHPIDDYYPHYNEQRPVPGHNPSRPHYHPPSDHHHHTTTYYPDYSHEHHYHHGKSVPETRQHKLGEVVRDTPEVAAAKAEHAAAVRRADQAAIASNPNDDGSYSAVHHGGQPIVAVASEQLFLPDTPEVAAAKAIHLEALRRAQAEAGPQIYLMPVNQYHNRVPVVPVIAVSQTDQHKLGVNVQDTPEVAAAKAAHLEAVRRAQLNAAREAQSNGFAPNNDYYYNPTRPYGQV